MFSNRTAPVCLSIILVLLLFATSFGHDFNNRLSSIQHLFSDDFSVDKCSVEDLQSMLNFVLAEGRIADAERKKSFDIGRRSGYESNDDMPFSSARFENDEYKHEEKEEIAIEEARTDEAGSDEAARAAILAFRRSGEIAPKSTVKESELAVEAAVDDTVISGNDDQPMENISSFERIAFDLSGVYIRRQISRSCPASLSLELLATNTTLGLSLPEGLLSKSKQCRSTMNNSSYTSLINETSPESVIFSLDAGAPSADSLHARIPRNALLCSCGQSKPFTSMSITPLSRYMVPLLMQRLKGVGLDTHVLEYIFAPMLDSVEGMNNTKRNGTTSTRATRFQKGVQEALSHFNHEYVLSLNREADIPAEAALVEQPGCKETPNFCVLQGGSLGARNTRLSTQNFVDSLMKSHNQNELPFPKLAGETFHLSNGGCRWKKGFLQKEGKAAESVQVVRVVGETFEGHYGAATFFATAIDGKECGRMELYRYSEILGRRTRLSTTTTAMARKIRSYVKRWQQSSADEDSANFLSFFPEFVDELRILGELASIFIGRISVSRCPNREHDAPIEFVLVKKSLSFFLCEEKKGSKTAKVCDEYADTNSAEADDEADLAVYLENANIEDVGFGSIADFTFFVSGLQFCGYTTALSKAKRFRQALENREERQNLKQAWIRGVL